MSTIMGVLAFFMIVTALKLSAVESVPGIIVSSPNLMRVGNNETVLVSIHELEPVDVTIKLKQFDTGNDEGIINETVVRANVDSPVCAFLYVNPNLIPSRENEEEVRYVYVTVSCCNLQFVETKQVLLSYEEGYVFIQTDKPVYTPNQSVKIRVINLDQYLTPSSQKIQLDIITPQDVIVRRNTFEKRDIRNGILSNTFTFHQEPMFGHWKIVAHYGKDLGANRTVEFEVKEYVLPTFSVKIHPPNYILQTDESIRIRVEARYVYGKAVNGLCYLKVGVQEEEEDPIIYHVDQRGIELRQGEAEREMNIIILLGENWFEENNGSRLYIEATVVEEATGHVENASDNSAIFVSSPYIFSWKRTIRYFKKGLPYEVKTDLKFMNGKPAPGVRVRVIATAEVEDQGHIVLEGAARNPDNVDEGFEPTEQETNHKGQVNFRLFVPRRCTQIRVELETVDLALIGEGDNPIDNNAKKAFDILPFESPNGNEYLVLRNPHLVINPNFGDVEVDVFLNSVSAAPIVTYFVLSRGKIMEYGNKAVANVDGIRFPVTFEMVPSARIVAYYISDRGHIIADSIWIEVARTCENSRLEVRPYLSNSDGGVGDAVGGGTIDPQSQIYLRVQGHVGTSVALLAVDHAVLQLRDYHRLTAEKMYGTMDEHDTGCGPGGGRNSADVFMNAGLMILTDYNLDVPRRDGLICSEPAEHNRRRRSLADQLENYSSNIGTNFACKRGHKRLGSGTCSEKAERFANLAKSRLPQLSEDYVGLHEVKWKKLMKKLMEVFIDCCEEAGRGGVGRVGNDDLADHSLINLNRLGEIHIRNDFRESWAFEVVEIPQVPDPQVLTNSVDRIYSVPGSITTWSLQAFGLHSNLSMCVIDPVDLTVFTKLFIQLHMPYSVVRKETVQIQATLFNYANQRLAVRMYLTVPDEICSEGTSGTLSSEKEYIIDGNDARTITYTLIGLEPGEFPIKVVALTPWTLDAVVKMLKVVPEGVVKSFHHSTILNPAKARIDRDIQEIALNDSLKCDGFGEVDDGSQWNCLGINLPGTAVPDTASCFVSVTGNMLGPILTAVISGLESFIRLPNGCGEQTMFSLAPLVYVLRYLNNTNSGTQDNIAKAVYNTERGVLHEMKYRHPDGSYSVHPTVDTSTWLTAFVGKVFCQASDFIAVDMRSTCGTIGWLMQAQRGDGAFTEGRFVNARSLMGGLQGDAAMTAFCLIAMNECQCEEQVPELSASSHKATKFLEGQLSNLDRPYAIAIVTYALALVGSERRWDANSKLKSIAIYDGASETRYWAAGESTAISVETTAYALLAQLVLEEISYSYPIVNWLSKQQNYGGSFKSTQDTVVALQALSEYATLNTGGTLDMYCNVTGAENYKTELRFEKSDVLVRKTKQVPRRSIKDNLLVKTSGEGIGQLNVEVKYNDLDGNSDPNCPFNLIVRSELIDKQAGTPFERGDEIRIGICVSYLGEEQTGMAILDVGLFSGFVPVSQSLENLRDTNNLIDRTELSGRSVIFYVNHIPLETEDPLCFEFLAWCDIVVGNLHNAAVHVYDYYNPDEECTEFYVPEGSNQLDLQCSDDQNDICTCVSSKCADCSGPEDETSDTLLQIACATADTYVYKIVVTNITTKNGYDIITGMVELVIKRGEDQGVYEGAERMFWVSSSCECPGMKRLRKYMVIGRKYLSFRDEVGLPGFKYIIDSTVTVRFWRKGRRSRPLHEVQEMIATGRSNCG